MKPSQLIQVVKLNVLANAVTYIEGPPGVGKSSIPVEAAKEEGWDCLVLPPGPTLEPVDFRGALKVVTKADAAEFSLPDSVIGTTCAFPPEFLPRKADKTTLVIIDDVPTAMPSVQAALFQLLLDRRLGSYIVPDNVHFVVTGNRAEDRAGASRTLTALDSRVNRVTMDVSYDDWIEWAYKNNIATEVIAFHKFNRGKYLHVFDPKKNVNPLPRTWAALSRKVEIIKKARAEGKIIPASMEIEWYKGDVGDEAAGVFVGFLKVFEDLPDPNECLKNPDKTKLPKDIGATTVLCTALSRLVKPSTMGNMLTYLARLDKEYEVLCLQDSINLNKALKETKAYMDWVMKNPKVLLGQSASAPTQANP